MKLYNFPWGPYPRRITHYLAEKGITNLSLQEVEFPHVPANWPAGFLHGLSPAGTLPVLTDGDAITIGNSLAILEYLEEHYPEPNLIGATPAARAATREMVAVLDEATTYLGIWARHGSRVNATRHTADLGAAAIGAERYASRLQLVESLISGDDFLIGNNISMADCVAIALLQFADDVYGVNIPATCPKLTAWYLRFLKRPSVPAYTYPEEIISLSAGLQEQTQCFI